ncbi:MAG: PAS domain S-box protein [Deltaproteobacteria bacterium]|nr:PAS domain S-box protein [Deltaproteobacteria bacterium]
MLAPNAFGDTAELITPEAGQPLMRADARQSGYLGYRGSGWHLLLDQPTALAFRPLTELARTITAIFAAATLLFATLAFGAGWLLVRPITDLARVARRVQRGDLLARAVLSSSSSSEVTSLQAAFNDMLEALNRSSEALRGSEERYRQLVELSPDGISLVDAEGNVCALNRQGVAMFGFASAEEAIGRKLFELIAPEETARVALEMEKAFSEGTLSGGEYILRRQDGGVFPAEVRASLLYDRSGKVQGVISVIRDVSDRRISEKERAHLLAELQRSNAELEQFAYVASHDLQEPLRMVAGFLQLLERRYKRQLDRDAQEFIGYAVDGAKRMQVLISDLLRYSRVTTHGKEFTSVDCEAALSTAASNLQAAIAESGAVIRRGALPTVPGDGMQLAQLFQNLLGNAIKYRGERKPEIHVSATRDDQPGAAQPPTWVGAAEGQSPRWVFSVRDNGIGIDPQYFEQVFVLFRRLHRSEEYAGTGIGLALCKKIVERHGGHIWLESVPGQGTTFYFTIPVGAGYAATAFLSS